MSAFPGFKSFGSNTNPQGQGSKWTSVGIKPWSSGAGQAPMAPGQQMKPMGLGALGALGTPQQPSLGAVAGKVQQYGQATGAQKPVGWQSFGNNIPGGKPIYAPGQQYQPSMRDLYGGALVQDFKNISQASEMNRQNNLQYGQGMVDRSQQEGAATERLGQQQGDALDALGQKIAGGASEQGNKFADLVKSRVEATEQGFKDRSAEDASAAAFGMDQQMESQLKMLDDPNLTPEQQSAMRSNMLNAYAPQKQKTLTEVASRFNDAFASLQTQGTGLISQAGQFALGHEMQAQQLAAGLAQAGANIRMGANALAVQRRLEGDQAGAQMLMNNPYSPTSLAAVFGEMMQVMESGAGTQPTGFNSQFMGAMR